MTNIAKLLLLMEALFAGMAIIASTATSRADAVADASAAQEPTGYRNDFPPISIAPGRFTADVATFRQYHYPDWFRDAKLGIWAHWGPQSVPMEGDWYARKMYEQGDKDYNDHMQRWGHPSKMGYKDIIPLWTAEKWDPMELMALYKKAGARYFVAQAVHHDNFDNWNSTYHSWNSVKMGPHRDMVGEWQKAAAAQRLRFGVSEHLGASFTWFQDAHKSDKTGPLAGVPYDGADPKWFELYHLPARADDTGWYSNDPRWQKEWFARIKDLVDQYHPDLLYSDGGLPFGNAVGSSLVAHLYNTSAARNGVADAVYNCKQPSNGMWAQDVERGVMPGISPYPWQSDTSIGDWFYNKHWTYRSADWVIQSLVDIVSKNGNLLINVDQRPDGTIDDDARKIVDQLAAWTVINGEGIFGTRPWLVYGEGKTHSKGGAFNENHEYTADDIRFTTKGQTTLYALAMGWPKDGKITIHSLAAFPGAIAKIKQISLLGTDGQLKYDQTADGLTVNLPTTKPCDYAICLKIEADDIMAFKPQQAVQQSNKINGDANGNFTLLADAADLHGGLQTEKYDDKFNIGFWDSASDTADWTVSIPDATSYKVTMEYASTADSAVAVEFGSQKLVSPKLASTGAFATFKQADLGTIKIGSAGDLEVTLEPADAKIWNAINVRSIKLTMVAK